MKTDQTGWPVDKKGPLDTMALFTEQFEKGGAKKKNLLKGNNLDSVEEWVAKRLHPKDGVPQALCKT